MPDEPPGSGPVENGDLSAGRGQGHGDGFSAIDGDLSDSCRVVGCHLQDVGHVINLGERTLGVLNYVLRRDLSIGSSDSVKGQGMESPVITRNA